VGFLSRHGKSLQGLWVVLKRAGAGQKAGCRSLSEKKAGLLNRAGNKTNVWDRTVRWNLGGRGVVTRWALTSSLTRWDRVSRRSDGREGGAILR